MKILVIADEEERGLWDFFTKDKVKDIDLILSAGDLDPRYLSFLVTMANVPVFYVHGNHDTKYEHIPPEGCDCIDGKLVTYKGIRILGLGGSFQYNSTVHQFTEKEMEKRIRKLVIPLWKNKGFDILLTHAPAKGFHDDLDIPHWGFEAFNDLINKFHPKYHIHGHVHKTYNSNFVRKDVRDQTTVINAYGSYIIEI